MQENSLRFETSRSITVKFPENQTKPKQIKSYFRKPRKEQIFIYLVNNSVVLLKIIETRARVIKRELKNYFEVRY